MDDFVLNYAETTGQLYRVGVVPAAEFFNQGMEDAAKEWAKDHIGTDADPIFTDMFNWGFEIVFESASLDQ